MIVGASGRSVQVTEDWVMLRHRIVLARERNRPHLVRALARRTLKLYRNWGVMPVDPPLAHHHVAPLRAPR